MATMSGRVIRSSAPTRCAILDGMNVRDSRVNNYPPRWNAAPSQHPLVIRRNPQTSEVSLDPTPLGAYPVLVPRLEGRAKPDQHWPTPAGCWTGNGGRLAAIAAAAYFDIVKKVDGGALKFRVNRFRCGHARAREA